MVYSQTELGETPRPIVGALCAWGRQHAAELDEIERRQKKAGSTG